MNLGDILTMIAEEAGFDDVIDIPQDHENQRRTKRLDTLHGYVLFSEGTSFSQPIFYPVGYLNDTIWWWKKDSKEEVKISVYDNSGLDQLISDAKERNINYEFNKSEWAKFRTAPYDWINL